jgi:hypothetical protein
VVVRWIQGTEGPENVVIKRIRISECPENVVIKRIRKLNDLRTW